MKKIISMVCLLSTINSNAAKLIYTNEETPTLIEKDRKYIKYMSREHGSNYNNYNDKIWIGDGSNIIEKEAAIKQLGFIPKIKGLNLYNKHNMEEVLKFEDQESADNHFLLMLEALRKHLVYDSNSDFENKFYAHDLDLTNKKTPRGTISRSKTTNIRYHTFNSDMYYFGDVINEFSSFNMTNSLAFIDPEHTDDTNLFLTGSNEENIKNEYTKNNFEIAVTSDINDNFHLFGSEAQKQLSASLINVSDLKDDKSKIIFGFYYGRRSGIIVDGKIYDENAKKIKKGTSFGRPKIQGLINYLFFKFPGLSYHQAKQFVLTSGSNEFLDSYTGFGEININKVKAGLSALNAGLIEEQKFFTGMYDKIYSQNTVGRMYYWADIPVGKSQHWNNDIKGSFPVMPNKDQKTCALEWYFNYNVYENKNVFSKGGNLEEYARKITTIPEDKKENKLCYLDYLPSEKNFYYNSDDVSTQAGLRVAGGGELHLKGKFLTEVPIQVLEGKLGIYNDIYGSVFPYEGTEVVVLGKMKNNLYINIIGMSGGKVRVEEDIKKLTIDELMVDNDVELNEDNFEIYKFKNDNSNRIFIKHLKGPRSAYNYLSNLVGVVVEKFTEDNSLVSSDVKVNPKKTYYLPRKYILNNLKSTPVTSNEAKKMKTNAELIKMLDDNYYTFGELGTTVKKEVPGYDEDTDTFLQDRLSPLNKKNMLSNIIYPEEIRVQMEDNVIFKIEPAE